LNFELLCRRNLGGSACPDVDIRQESQDLYGNIVMSGGQWLMGCYVILTSDTISMEISLCSVEQFLKSSSGTFDDHIFNQ
jgi:hypothetical protein